jgi:hypothetical protein
MQDVITQLLSIVLKVTGNLDQPTMDEVVARLDQITLPVLKADALALLSLLPNDGDPAQGVNWTILHTIEASSEWPIWDALNEPQNEWMETLEIRLNNAGINRPPTIGWAK